MKILKQNGFSAIEGLLILVIVGLIGFTGWYVWHSKNNSDKALSEAQAVSNSTLPKTAASSSSSVTKQEFVTIKEWGVRAPYSGKLTLSYKLSDNNREANFT